MSSGDSWRVGLPSLELELQGAKLSASVVYILQFTSAFSSAPRLPESGGGLLLAVCACACVFYMRLALVQLSAIA